MILGELKQPRQPSRADGQSFHLQKDGWQASLDEKVERGSPYGNGESEPLNGFKFALALNQGNCIHLSTFQFSNEESAKMMQNKRYIFQNNSKIHYFK